jgi:aminobenzoyl-glutamate utilization protein B
MTARDFTSEYVDATVEWLRQLAQGAAMGTQTKADFVVRIGSKEMISNETLARRVWEHMQHVPLEWSTQEQEFAKACQKAMNLPEKGMATAVLPFIKDFTVGGSTDVADVAWNTPTCFFGWPTHPIGVSAHTWVVTACGGMSIGDKGTIAAAVLMAALGLDLMTEPDLRTAAKEELKQRLNGRTYKATLNYDATLSAEAARRFIKGPGDEALNDVRP